MFRWMQSRTVLRAAFLTITLLSASVLAAGYLGVTRADAAEGWAEDDASAMASGASVEPRDGVTVITTQVFRDWVSEGKLVAFARNGSVLYYDESYSTYHDVDPSPKGDRTVTYLAAKFLSASECPTDRYCTLNVVERVNLSTGETELLHTTILPKRHKWHDVDRINATHFLVADIVTDQVYALNVETGEITWRWKAAEAYSKRAGGGPGDWTHVNDVERLPDGRVMVSVRNMDQVAFIEPGEGLQEGWTLGSEDEFDTLYEQHNPDYIPESNGGPAVVVADSENNRIVEYQRRDGEWTRTWVWRDTSLQWPRDADRLPNGNTLVTDSNGNRVLEVAPNGTVVWSVRIGLPYEAERLGTGDESAGGPSMARLVRQGAVADGSPDDGRVGTVVAHPPGLEARVAFAIKSTVPAGLLSSALFVLPSWIGVLDLPAVVGLLVGLVGLVLVETWSFVRRTLPGESDPLP